jgi:CheY-like chemotaxis protein
MLYAMARERIAVVDETAGTRYSIRRTLEQAGFAAARCRWRAQEALAPASP